MKTITEFTGFQLKNALQKQQELTTGGKTAEELPAAMGEAFKLEGDKLKLFLNALDVVKTKNKDLKRVVVLTLAEGEKAPQGAEKREEHLFLIELFPAPPQAAQKGHDSRGRGGRDDKRGGGKGKGRRGEGRDGRGDGRGEGRGPRRDSPTAPALAPGQGQGQIIARPRSEIPIRVVAGTGPIVTVVFKESAPGGAPEKGRRQPRRRPDGPKREVKPVGPPPPLPIARPAGSVAPAPVVADASKASEPASQS